LLGKRSAERDYYPSVWDVFGGHLEPGESCERTLRRELQEELGILPTAWQYLETLCESAPAEGAGLTCHFYVVTKWRGTPKNLEPGEHSDMNWYLLEEATQLDLAHPEYARILRSATSLLAQNENTSLGGGA
jgi:8-oxo-dGTP diphosphatase